MQKELDATRTTYDRALAKADASRKASEEWQSRMTTDLKNQEQHLTALSKRMQDLHIRQEYAVKERASSQETNRVLRDAILHALKSEQADLQQRLKRLDDSILQMEQGRTSPPVQSVGAGQPAAVEGSKPDSQKPEHQPANTPDESTRTN
ncbi:MAG: hypothetical protein JSR62_06630 [Nitrospira sp.]|nr:hypothetical protein [Nitrospira sp.]